MALASVSRVGRLGHYSSLRSYQTAFLFPGQGVQSVGMVVANGAVGDAAKREIKQLYDTASEILGYDLYEVCLNGPEDKINSTRVAQVAIFVNSMATLVKMKHDNSETIDQCSVAAGLSLGEYSSLCFAGALSFEDGVRLTKARGEAMQWASDQRLGGILAVTGLSEEQVVRLCDEVIEATSAEVVDEDKRPFLGIGSYLSSSNFAISGDLDMCKALQVVALEQPGVKVARLLAVAGAFHSPLMLPAREALKEVLEVTTFTPQNMRCPVYVNVTGDTCYDQHSSEDDIKACLLDQLVKPVRWDKTMNLILSNPSFTQAFELGPGTVCSGIVKAFNRRAKVTSYKL